ncbi:MAG: hypothetical protein E4G91_09955 [Candidatus Zixiibacteriota bacterium]|nr:MAG: hypothetical protein E4G91_09955 [candidate division Zixibacteria bacterium]
MESHDQELCRVIADYRSAYPDPIALSAGDELTIEDRETEWSGWIWCTTREGKSGWVPEKYVQRSGSTGVAERDYDAMELSVTEGEQLTIIEEVSSWYWCRTKDGRLGWVPKQNVEPLRKA